jgi:hypothetical protein
LALSLPRVLCSCPANGDAGMSVATKSARECAASRDQPANPPELARLAVCGLPRGELAGISASLEDEVRTVVRLCVYGEELHRWGLRRASKIQKAEFAGTVLPLVWLSLAA